MSYGSDVEDIIIAATSSMLAKKTKKKKLMRRRFRIHPYLLERREKGRYFKDFQDLRDSPQFFKENFHMEPAAFDFLLSLVDTELKPKPHARPDSLSSKEKLCLTLEYKFLASGSIQRHIGSVYRVSKQVLGVIIEQTCEVIYSKLKVEYIKEFSTHNWIEAANEFHSRWNFPNCLGAIDGKHIGIKCPKNAGSLFYNYKGFHSIVLMAVADANYGFLYFDVGAYGSEGDSTVFRESEFGQRLSSETLDFPPDAKILGKHTPFYFIGDDAFPLHKRILKPYAPREKSRLLEEHRLFNYRLSRARRCVENAFGILCSRWVCLARTMFLSPSRAQKVVAACCALHNFLIKRSSVAYYPTGFGDKLLDDGTFIEGSWREFLPSNSCYSQSIQPQNNGRPTETAKLVRDRLCEYINSEEGAVSWQYDMV